MSCSGWGRTCPRGHCTDPRVAVRRILVRHLTHTPLTAAPFPDRLAALLDDLEPHIRRPR